MNKRASAKKAIETVTAADARIARAVDGPVGNTVGDALHLPSKLADQPQLRTLAGLLVLGGLVAGRPRLARAGMRMLLAHELATAAKNVVKEAVDRTRPRSAKTLADKKPALGDHTAKEDTSFPSGHSAGATAVAFAFSREFPEYRGPALAAAGTLAAVQVPRSAHYVSDVIAGVLIGILAEQAGNSIWRAAKASG